MNKFYLILKNLSRKKMRLILLLFSITISFMIFTVLSAFQTAMDSGVDLSADDRLVVVNKINFTQSLPYAYMARIESIEGVRSATHLNWFGGYYREPQNFMSMFATANDNFFDVYDELVVDEQQKQNYLNNRQGLLVGSVTAQRYQWEVGDKIPISSNIFSNVNGNTYWDFVIEAIYSGNNPQIDTSSVYFHYDYYNESITFGRDQLGFIVLRTANRDLNETIIETIDAKFENNFAETETLPEKAFNKQFIEQLGNISLIIQSVVFAAFFTILLLVGNSMVMSIRERTNEIAVLKTLGFQSGSISMMVLCEVLLLVFIGGSLGLLLGSIAVSMLNNYSTFQITMVINAPIVMQAIGAMLLLGFLTGVLPAWNALRLNIVTTLSRGQ